jgi:hypothetical protein
MPQEKITKTEFLELPMFINRGKPPYDDSDPVEVKKPPILTTRGKMVVTSLSVLLVSILIFWLF